MSAVMKLAEGNPGAIRAIAEMVEVTPKADPGNLLGGFGMLLNLDSSGIYGTRVWMLYKDVCGEDPAKAVPCIGLQPRLISI